MLLSPSLPILISELNTLYTSTSALSFQASPPSSPPLSPSNSPHGEKLSTLPIEETATFTEDVLDHPVQVSQLGDSTGNPPQVTTVAGAQKRFEEAAGAACKHQQSNLENLGKMEKSSPEPGGISELECEKGANLLQRASTECDAEGHSSIQGKGRGHDYACRDVVLLFSG